MGNRSDKGNFKKNDVRINRKGAPTLDPILKQIRELERTELTLEFSKMLRMIKPQLEDVIRNPKTCIKDLGIAKAILKWLETGDFRYIQPYIEYIFGRPKEIHELTGKDGGPIETASTIPEATLKALGEAIVKAKAGHS